MTDRDPDGRIPPPPMTPAYQSDRVTLYVGDVLDLAPCLGRMVDLVVCDPPFVMPAKHYQSRVDRPRCWGDTAIMSGWWKAVVQVLVARMNRRGHLLAFCDDESYPVFYPGLYERFDTLGSLVWDKTQMGMGSTWRHAHELIIAARWSTSDWHGGHSRQDILRYKPVPQPKRVHAVDKPVPMLCDLIEATTGPDYIVLDPMIGGGSTIEAALKTGRQAIGFDVDPDNIEITIERLKQGLLL